MNKMKWLKYNIIFPFFSYLPYTIGYRAAAAYWKLDSTHNNEAHLAFKTYFPQCLSNLNSEQNALEGFVDENLNMMAHEMMDIFYLDSSSGKNCFDLVSIDGLEHLSQAKEHGCGVLLVTSHYGRPVMLSCRVGLAGEAHVVVTQNINDKNLSLCPQDADYLRFKVASQLRFTKGPWVARGTNTRDIYRALAAGQTVLILFDVFEPNKQKTKEYDFLGGKLTIPTGIERLAEKSGARMVYAGTRCEGMRMRIDLRPLPDDPCAGIRGAVGELEQDVLNAPAQWWQWFGLSQIWQRNS